MRKAGALICVIIMTVLLMAPAAFAAEDGDRPQPGLLTEGLPFLLDKAPQLYCLIHQDGVHDL